MKLLLVLTLMLVCGPIARAQAQSREAAQPGPSVERLLADLSAELRTLRASLERWHMEDGQLLIALERFRLQRDLAATAANRLEVVRGERAKTQAEALNMQGETQNAEANLRNNTEPQQSSLLAEIAREAGDGLQRARSRDALLAEQEHQLTVESEEERRDLQLWQRWLETAGSQQAQAAGAQAK
jgi:hypothetical protein